MSYLKERVLDYQIYLLKSVDIELKNTSLIRISKKEEDYFIYLPYNTALNIHDLNICLDDYDIISIDLEKHHIQTLKHQDFIIDM
ncbi:hypothetical protein HMPREF9488_00793 [Coprobacillus cateniformis]|uniref:Uncharacterized protein n=1 Tax=Coprobacillus cateniformis TaxID=100884 RepID=E7G7Q5_9FIRM|nr:hypothetical protein [Coprobacillus cateniformis]EFW05975.1 hypothetical protein HMPREF9488_00793 [Coprobacillus cateniformis]